MRLIDLFPKLDGTLDEGMLTFNCPTGHQHAIVIPVGKYGDQRGWEATGEYPDKVTLTPSIHVYNVGGEHCGWHGYITNSEVSTV